LRNAASGASARALLLLAQNSQLRAFALQAVQCQVARNGEHPGLWLFLLGDFVPTTVRAHHGFLKQVLGVGQASGRVAQIGHQPRLDGFHEPGKVIFALRIRPHAGPSYQ
jgi:hypothetical protein